MLINHVLPFYAELLKHGIQHLRHLFLCGGGYRAAALNKIPMKQSHGMNSACCFSYLKIILKIMHGALSCGKKLLASGHALLCVI